MHCTKCGREIGTNSSCSYCGTAQKKVNPSTTLADFVLDAPGIGGFKPLDTVDDFAISKRLDPLGEIGFKTLGPVNEYAAQEMDSLGRGGFKPLQPAGEHSVYGETQSQDPLGSGGFKPLGFTESASASGKTQDPLGRDGFKPLDSAENPVSGETQGMNLPGGGGFKPIVEGIPANEGSSETRKKDLLKVPESPAPHIQWKRWMFLIPLCCTMLLLVIFNICNKPESSKKDVLSAAIDNYIQNEIYIGESLPLMQQYQNAILEAITYDILSYDWIGGTMDVEFAYIDVLHLADSITDPNISEDEYYSTCIKMIRSKECKMITEVIRVSFEFSGEEYSVISSDPLINVLSGGVLNYYLELLEGTDYE